MFIAGMNSRKVLNFRRKVWAFSQRKNVCSDRLPIGTKSFTLDSKAMEEHSDIILSHLKARNAKSVIEAEVKNIAQLRKKRTELTNTVNEHRRHRNLISNEIALNLKNRNTQKADQLKKEVECIKRNIADIDSQLGNIELELDIALLAIPNLLDDR